MFKRRTRQANGKFLQLPDKGKWKRESHAPCNGHMTDKQPQGRKGRVVSEKS